MIRRYNLALSTDLYDDLQAAADRRGTTVVALLRTFTKLGLIALGIEETTGSVDLVGGDGSIRRLVLP